MNWMALLWLIGAALLVWLAVRLVRNNPNLFNRENLSKSSTTLALLTLMIIIVVGFCILLLKNG